MAHALSLLSRAPAWVSDDAEWASALHALSAPALRGKDIEQYIDFERQTIAFAQMLQDAASWSHGQLLLVALACELFNGEGPGVSVRDLCVTLDEPNFSHAIGAMQRRRG